MNMNYKKQIKIKYPANLKKAGRKFYRKVQTEFVFEDHHDVERLAQAAACLDEIATAEAVLEKEGRFFTTKSGIVREHPALKAIRDFRTLFVRIVRELGLDLEPAQPPKPPGRY
jgi:phage terminase small subunit